MPHIPHHGRRNPDRHPRELPDNMYDSNGRLRRGLMTPRSVYRRLIFTLILPAEQHTLPSREIRSQVQRRLSGHFTDADLSQIQDREPRWANSLQWERKKMVMEGLLETTLSAGHGVWRLTRKCVREAREHLN